MLHLNLSSADARPHDDVGELHQVQDISLVTAQTHCLCLLVIMVNISFSVLLDCNKQTRRKAAAADR